MKTMNAVLCLLFLCGSICGQDIGSIRLEPEEPVRVSKREFTWASSTGIVVPALMVTLNSGTFVYGVRYDKQWYSGTVGIAEPTSANWPTSGLLNILINGERFDLLQEHDWKLELEEGETGKAMFSWENEKAKVGLNFYLFSLDDKLFLEVLLEPKKDVETLELAFQNYTAGFHRDRKQVFYTSERKIENPGWAEMNLPSETWFLLTDDNWDYSDNPDSQGPSAIAYLPDGFTRAQVFLGGYGAPIRFRCNPEARRFLFALWEFPQKGNAEVAETMNAHAEDAMDKMQKLWEGR